MRPLQDARFAHAALPHFDTADEKELTRWTQALEAPASDLHLARRWQRLPKRLAQLVELRGGTWDELIALLNAAFVLWAVPGDQLELDLTSAGPVSLQQNSWMRPTFADTSLKTLADHYSLRRVALHDMARWWHGCDAFGDPMDVPQPQVSIRQPVAARAPRSPAVVARLAERQITARSNRNVAGFGFGLALQARAQKRS